MKNSVITKKDAKPDALVEPDATVEIDWAAIRVKYETQDLPMSEVVAGTGMQWQKVAIHAARHGWKLRKPRSRAQKDDARRDAGLAPTRLATRLKRLIAREISSIEKEDMANRPAADRERDARRLSSLVRSLEKLNDIKAAKNKREREAETNEPDSDDLRNELAHRLARFAAGKAADGVAGKPEPERTRLAD